jgi:hypothetical protein
MAGRRHRGDQLWMLFHAHAAAEEGGFRTGRCEGRQEMRCALRIRPVIEGDGDGTFAVAILVDAPNDRGPISERETKRDQGVTSFLS